jgi:hypothetical protein
MTRVCFLLCCHLLLGLAAADPTVGRIDPRDEQVVRDVQLGLYNLDYQPGPIDGIAGPRTAAAIRAYQQAVGRPVTGHIDHDLWTHLRGAAHSGPWGAYAMSPATGASGVAVLAPTRAAAETAAMGRCGVADCQVVAFTGCLARTPDAGLDRLGLGDDSAGARRSALLHCSMPGDACAVIDMVCADGSGAVQHPAIRE